MLHVPKNTITVSKAEARRAWIRAQKLDEVAAFGKGVEAVNAAVAHLGYVQIDTINVIERCHHHILFTRIPEYRRADLHRAQTIDKTVFEYWAHALAYIPTVDMRHYSGEMRWRRQERPVSEGVDTRTVTDKDLRRVLSRIRRKGPISLRDITDDELVEKDHAWASRKPSARVLRRAFYRGELTVSERTGILKTYDLTTRHFGWKTLPRPAPARETNNYLLDRALRSQGIVTLDSICHLDAPRKAAIKSLIDGRVRRKELVRVKIEGIDKPELWAQPESLIASEPPPLVHILSPFDPLIIQRKRLKLFFDYDHLFEAYVPKAKRKLGYFALPVLVGDEIVAALDLKTDREKGKVKIQKWTWLGKAHRMHKPAIEEALGRFEKFQLGK
jgi:uncharacterized protein YcaQ